jgi:hypothetical protein
MDVKPGMIRMSLALVLAVTTVSYVVGESCAAQHHHSMPPRTTPSQPAAKPQPPAQPQPQPVQPIPPVVDLKKLGAIQEALARAVGHVEAGYTTDAVKELRQIQASLESFRQAIVKNTPSPFVNDRCPILGTAIDPTKVPANLTRLYGSRTVAFCCAGCPQKWDQLANSEKTAKLASGMVQPQ